MFQNVNQIIIKAITPIHAGMGRTLGLIDMPIQKEKHTGIPKIEGSTIKGCLRELYRIKNQGGNIDKLFGPEKGEDSASILGFTDAKLLFYPIITLEGIFAYVTCPYLLNRYFQDEILKKQIENQIEDEKPDKNMFLEELQEGKCIILDKDNEHNTSIVLDEYYFQENKYYFTNNEEVLKNLDLKNFNLNKSKKAVIISDNDFIEIITLCREVITRNKINHDTGTVAKSSLFSEEYLPSETILYTLLLKNGIKDNMGDLYKKYLKEFPKFAQIGGNFTIGKGIVEMSVIGGENKGGEK
ncbi:type III-B CRISPR module RAMP protein Cmr4 [Clostridium cochlearium]|uniref:type III-B CRISPR module RAMP protein Cmr4 n=1 Tax=Clostridium cochlearium TaxID=1494 RepID=UPI000BBCC175|nr:type III-B CRISPR module RAMP protein Cmr4 [Clostridium cochlearium]